MRAGLVEAIVRGDHVAWLGIGALWLVTTIYVLAQRRDRAPGAERLVVLLLLTAATATIGVAVATALAIPRLAFRPELEPLLVNATGDTWRRLRGPTAAVMVDGVPDLAVPTIDSAGRWILVGLLSGAPIDVPAARPDPPDAGGPRLCRPPGEQEMERCRAWPKSWPNPERPPIYDEMTWLPDRAAGALAYDVESDQYLVDARTDRSSFELLGRVTNDAPREGVTALFLLRRIAKGRLQAMRVIATPNTDGAQFRLQRADVSLTRAPAFLRTIARPLLVLASFTLPLAALAYLFAPALLRLRLRRAGRHDGGPQLRLLPTPDPRASSRRTLATVADDATMGERRLLRGSVVELFASDGRPVESHAWLELRGTSAAIALVPADTEPFRRSARAWIYGIVEPITVFTAGLCAVLPAIVALINR